MYAIKQATGEVRAYRVDRIEGVSITDISFQPRYAVELSVALPVATWTTGSPTVGPRAASKRATAPSVSSPGHDSKSRGLGL